MKKKQFVLKLNDNLDFFFSKKLNKMFILGKFGVCVFFMPSFFFSKNSSFCFLNKFFFVSFIKHLRVFIKKVTKIFFFRLKLRGLGFKMKIVERRFLKFFFGLNFFFLLFLPKNVILGKKGRAIFAFSANKEKLNNIFFNIIALKKFDYYERNNMFIVRHKIIYFKKRK